MRRLLTVIMCGAVLLAGCGDAEAEPASVIERYIAAYNTGDIDGLMAVFSEQSVITGHPMAARAEGLEAIRNMQIQDLNAAAVVDAYSISNVNVSGKTVTWDHVWTSGDGREFCQKGHTARIEDGRILTWTWPSGGFDCP